MNIYTGELKLHQWYIPVIGILPILVAVESPRTGIAMGLVFCGSYVLSSLVVLVFRPVFSARIQWVVLIAVTATSVALAERILQAWNYGLSVELGIYLPLLAMNGLLLGGLQEYVLRKPLRAACFSILITAIIVLITCIVTGMIRGLAAIPVLHDSSGLFLLVALALAAYNAIAGATGKQLNK